MPDREAALEAVMRGREERAAAQSRLLLLRGGSFVCQITLNIPGFPKRLNGDELLIKKCKEDLLRYICRMPLVEVQLDNGAGLALLQLYEGGHGAIYNTKRAAIFIEENKDYGRVVDIDVITVSGPLSRVLFNFAPRRCLLCDKDSKECARECNHTYEELRAEAQALIDGIRFSGARENTIKKNN